MSRDRLDPLLAAGLIATVAVDAVAVWATNVSREEPAAARWTRAAGRMAPGIPRRASLAAMLAIAATGALAVVVEQALGGPFNLRLAGGAGLLAVPAVVAAGALVAGSRDVAAGAALLQGATAALLLLFWDSPRWYAFSSYEREDAVLNLYLAGVLVADAVLLWAALRPARAEPRRRGAGAA